MNIAIFVFIIIGGILQAMGGVMSAQLYKSLGNPWLASTISFSMIVAFFFCAFLIGHKPLPTTVDIINTPWWAPLAGLTGAVAMYAGLAFIGKIGAGTYTALNVNAAIIASIVIDHFGFLNVNVHQCSLPRMIGAGFLVAGVALVSSSDHPVG